MRPNLHELVSNGGVWPLLDSGGGCGGGGPLLWCLPMFRVRAGPDDGRKIFAGTPEEPRDVLDEVSD